MPVIFFEGFETCGDELGLANQAITRPNVTKRFKAVGAGGIPSTDSFFLIDDDFGEGFALQMGQNSFSNGNFVRVDVPEELRDAPGPSARTWIVGMYVHLPSTAKTFNVLQLRGIQSGITTTNVLRFEIENCANLNVIRPLPDVEIANVDGVFAVGQWRYIEIKIRQGDSTESLIEVEVDGTNVLGPISPDTSIASLSTQVVDFNFHSATNSTGDVFVAYDDIYVGHTDDGFDFLGPCRVRSIPPESDSAPNWEASTPLSDNYELVDENGLQTSDYVQTDVNDTTERYNITDEPTGSGDAGVIYGVKLEGEFRNTTGGTPEITMQIESGGNLTEESFDVTNTTTFVLNSMYSFTDPNTGSSWQVGGVNALRAGVKFLNKVQ